MTNPFEKVEEKLHHAKEELIEAKDHVKEELHHAAHELHEVEEKVVQAALQTDKVQIQFEITPRLKLGVAVIIVSFLVGYPIGFLAGVIMGPIWIFYFYAASWVIFLAGIAIGGRPAQRAVATWHVKVRHKISSKWKR